MKMVGPFRAVYVHDRFGWISEAIEDGDGALYRVRPCMDGEVVLEQNLEGSGYLVSSISEGLNRVWKDADV